MEQGVLGRKKHGQKKNKIIKGTYKQVAGCSAHICSYHVVNTVSSALLLSSIFNSGVFMWV